MNAAPPPSTRPLRIEPDHPALPGHFPGRPVVPGVVLLDCVLEAATEVLGREVEVAELGQAKFLAPLLPGEQAEIAIEFAGTALRFRVSRAGRLLAQGQFLLRSEAAA
jgi:3-hydroxymyristoyl/3-hydroxydecanoyl-(acyl carrier protein) dehydratase